MACTLWVTMRKFNISANLVRTIEQLYEGYKCSRNEWQHRRMVQNNSRSKAMMSSALFNIFLEGIIFDALEEHDGKVSIGGRNITNLRFADDIAAVSEEEQELEALVKSLD